MDISLDEFFRDHADSELLFYVLYGLINEIGMNELSITKSQVAFKRESTFAWVWIPGRYLHGRVAPLVLSVAFPRPDPSPRWKEIAKLAHSRFMHHLELNSIDDINNEVRAWLHSAWEQAK